MLIYYVNTHNIF